MSVNGGLSKKFPLCQGVPQGSCLGPLLFFIYTHELFNILERHLPQVHCYADDTQPYVSFSPNQSAEADTALKSITDCISDVRSWRISDNLMLNDDKTNFQRLAKVNIDNIDWQLAKVNINNIKVGSAKMSPVSAVRNLGSWFDSQLTMSSHISKLCSVAFYHLCNIQRIRKYLSQETAGTLVHAFITSRIDYCNSLLYGLPNNQLVNIRRVLNAAARLVCNAPRFFSYYTNNAQFVLVAYSRWGQTTPSMCATRVGSFFQNGAQKVGKGFWVPPYWIYARNRSSFSQYCGGLVRVMLFWR